MKKIINLSPVFILIISCCVINVISIRCPFRRKCTTRSRTVFPAHKSTTTNNSIDCLYVNKIPCSETYPYRSYNGSCNNLKHPNWGMAYTPYSRILPGRYEDNIQIPRQSVTGKDLPWPRILSVDIFNQKSTPDPDYNLALVGLGKMIAHDMGHQALKAQAGLSQPQSCCRNGKFDPTKYSINKCFPILIPKNDPNYSSNGIECFPFDRSLTDKDLKCPSTNGINPVNQINAVSHFLDLSLVYGNFKNVNSDIREFNGGRLVVSKYCNDTYDLLPQTGDFCVKNLAKICFRNGDSRANQNPTLLIMETIFLREHNRIANKLEKLNPYYNDEKLFQIARKINIAKYQHIIYYEYLPIVLGRKNLLKYNVIYNRNTNEYINDYNPSVNPSVTNENAMAALKFFHTQIRGHLDLVDEGRQKTGSLRLSDHINYPDFMLKKKNFDDLTRGMASQRADKTDKRFTKEVTLYLKKLYLNKTLGYDLRSIDIQRDRDHGLPTYNDFRQACGLRRAVSWNDLLNIMTPENVINLQDYYKHPDDIDLSVGGGLERHIENSLAGPTYLCILTEQFYRSRVGDRFFYENGSNKFIRFTRAQLQEIRNANLARLFCDNGNSISFMQPFVLKALSYKNDLVSCKQIKKVDLLKWQE